MTIPKQIARAMTLERGDKVLVSLNNGDMIVRKKEE
jgi:AbrB family looped-hinge helix DNA binding protein